MLRTICSCLRCANICWISWWRWCSPARPSSGLIFSILPNPFLGKFSFIFLFILVSCVSLCLSVSFPFSYSTCYRSINQEEFKGKLVPSINKYLHRSPEIALGCVASIMSISLFFSLSSLCLSLVFHLLQVYQPGRVQGEAGALYQQVSAPQPRDCAGLCGLHHDQSHHWPLPLHKGKPDHHKRIVLPGIFFYFNSSFL